MARTQPRLAARCGKLSPGRTRSSRCSVACRSNWDGLKVTPDEFLEDGDTVVVLGHNEGRGKSTGDEWKVPFVHAWRVRDGKAERVQLLYDTGVTARALGV